jgi:signal transduction histidine kinase
MSRNVKLRYMIPALIALMTIVYGVVTSSVNTRENLRDRNWEAHTREVIEALKSTLECVLNLETGQRGFIIVGEESYLLPYQEAITRVDEKVEGLAHLTKDNPEQQLRVSRIKELIELRKESLRKAIAARRENGLQAAAQQVKTGEGKAQMDQLRELIGETQAAETALLAKRQDKLTRSLLRTNRTVIISGCIAIGAGLLGGTLLLLFLSARDREESLRAQKEKAEEADRAKSDFLAMMSHEIRTPMNAILGFGELLHDVVQSPQEKHYASAILTSGNSLLSLINDILDLSKIEAGKIDIQAENVVMSRFVSNLETLFSFRAAEKGLVYTVRADPSVPPLLSFDALRLRQVLVNLAGNAIKFCREGSVTVTLSADPATEDGSVRLRIEVADTGIGISEEHLDEIFRPFYQIDSRQGRQFQGTGLGLSISRRLVEAMDGTLKVESTLGKGSVFRVCLPTSLKRLPDLSGAEETSSQAVAVDFNRLLPAKIVVADDEPLNRELIRNYLAGSPHQVFEAENGEQAVALCVKYQPDLVLMDIRMPAMDGREALARLRADERTRHIPLIAVTASSLLNSQQELKTIFDGFSDKPISRSRLFMELAKFLPAAEPALPLPVASKPPHSAVTGSASPALVAALQEIHDTVWPDLAKIVPAQGTMRFASHLTTLAVEHDCPALASHAQELAQAAETMDFTEAGRLLRYFPQLLTEIRSSHD